MKPLVEGLKSVSLINFLGRPTSVLLMNSFSLADYQLYITCTSHIGLQGEDKSAKFGFVSRWIKIS